MMGPPVLIILLLAVIVGLVVYITRLQKRIRENDNPLLLLPRKERANYVRAELEHVRQMNNLNWQEKLNQSIGVNRLPFRESE